MNFKAMIFDMDGVIIDSEPINLEVDNYVLDKCGVDSSQINLDKFVGMTNPEMWSIIKEELNLKESIPEILDMHTKAKVILLNESDHLSLKLLSFFCFCKMSLLTLIIF